LPHKQGYFKLTKSAVAMKILNKI